jgi:hypothetical protein
MAFRTRKILITLSLLVIFGSAFSALSKLDPARKTATTPAQAILTRPATQLVSQQNGEIVLEWECPDILLNRDPESGKIMGIDMPGAGLNNQTGIPQLPRIEQLLDCLPGRVAVQIVDMDVESRQLGEMQPTPEDFQVDERVEDAGEGQSSLDDGTPPLTMAERVARTPLLSGWWPPEVVTVQEGGTYRGHRLMSIQFNPVQVDARHGLARIARRVRIRVTMPRSETAGDRLPDRPSETAMLQNMLGVLAPTAISSRMREAYEGQSGSRASALDDFNPLQPRWKLIIRRNGIIRVTAADLLFAGCPVDQITTLDTHIKNRGVEVPIYFSGENDGHFDEGDFIEFYGMPNIKTHQDQSPALYSDPWTDENVYWLSWGDGVTGTRLADEDGTYHAEWPSHTIRTITNVRTKIHYERNDRYDRLAYADVNYQNELQTRGPLGIYQEHWFYGNRIDGMTTRNITVSIPAPDARSFEPITIRAALTGFSYPSGNNSGNHRAIVFLNGQTVTGLAAGRTSEGDDNTPWVGQTDIILQSRNDSTSGEIIPSDLLDGENVISVSLPGDGLDGPLDKIFANWFEIEYNHALKAVAGVIEFPFDQTRGDTFSYDIRGFGQRNVQVWKIGHSRLTNLNLHRVVPADEGPSWAAKFQLISDGDYQICVFNDDVYPKPPAFILPETSSRNLRTLNGAEYLMIFHDSFANEASLPFLLQMDSLRRVSFNGSVDTIRVSSIYEQFNDGITDPIAIRNFLKYAYDHWTVRPTHVCLIGDGILDARATVEEWRNLIPSFYPLTTQFGGAACDMLFGEVSGPPWDITPDIAVGRISCRTPEEFGTYVSKLITYQNPASGYASLAHSTVLMVSDHRDGQFNFDRNFSEPTGRLLPEAMNINRVYLDSLQSSQGPQALRDAFWKGAVLVNYNGHGGGGLWSGTLLTVENLPMLQNTNTFPLVTNFTCYVGAFDERAQAGVLGEMFLWVRRGGDGPPVGAIGAYSSSGVGWAQAGASMQRKLYDYAAELPGMTIGQLVQLNKIRYWSGRGDPYTTFLPPCAMQLMMNLLGDPGVKLALPQRYFSSFVPDSIVVRHGTTIQLHGDLPWEPSQATGTEVYLIPYNGSFETRDVVNETWVGNTLRDNVPVISLMDAFPAPPLYTRHFDSLTVEIPNRFTSAQGHVVIYALDHGGEGQPRDAIGSFLIFNADSLTGGLRVFDIATYPNAFIYSDSLFAIQAHVAHRDGIEAVKARGTFRPAQGPVVLDTVAMTEVEPGLWRTPFLGPYSVRGGSYHVQFFAKPAGGDYLPSESATLTLEQAPDFGIEPRFGVLPEYHAGTRPMLQLPVTISRYLNTRPVSALPILLTAVHDSSYVLHRLPPLTDTTIVAIIDSFSSRVSVTNFDSLPNMFETMLPTPFLPMPYRITVKLDPENIIAENNESNNIWTTVDSMPNLYPAASTQGSYVERLFTPERHVHRFWKPGGTDTLRLQMASGALPVDSATLVYSGPKNFTAAERADLGLSGLYQADTSRVPYFFKAVLGDSSETLLPGAQVEVQLNYLKVSTVVGDSALRRLQQASGLVNRVLFVKRAESPVWRKLSQNSQTFTSRLAHIDTVIVHRAGRTDTIRVDTTYNVSGRVSGFSESLGQFAMFRVVDSNGPSIEFTADGLHFSAHSVLPRHPQMYVNMTDLSGVDRAAGKFWLVLDHDTIPESMITWTDTLVSSNNQSAMIRPDLEPGTHVLHCRATDNNGISDTLTAEFEVAGGFDIGWAINYPNPFRKTTTITYLLTDVTDDFVQIKVFTVSGRLIRTLREPSRQSANYREIEWDGKDEKGNEVANGVYIAKIKASQGKKHVEKLVKMAKVR